MGCVCMELVGGRAFRKVVMAVAARLGIVLDYCG